HTNMRNDSHNLDGILTDEERRRIAWLHEFNLDKSLPIEQAVEKLRQETMPATSPQDFNRTLEHMYANEMAASRQSLANEIMSAGYRKPDVTPPGLDEQAKQDALRAQAESGTIDAKRPNSGLLPTREPVLLPPRLTTILPKSGENAP